MDRGNASRGQHRNAHSPKQPDVLSCVQRAPTPLDWGKPLITNLEIKGYRGIEYLEMTGLTQLTLIVGNNNCGKTSVLEALRIVCGDQPVEAIWEGLRVRNELIEAGKTGFQAYVRSLFWNFQLQPGAQFCIHAEAATKTMEVCGVITNRPRRAVSDRMQGHTAEEDQGQPVRFGRNGPLWLQLRLGNTAAGSAKSEPFWELEVEGQRGIGMRYPGGWDRLESSEVFPVTYLHTRSMVAERLIDWFSEVLTHVHESHVVSALKLIEPRTQSVAVLPSQSHTLANIIVQLEGISERIPITSMGDGMWTILGIVLAIINTKNGVLLIDEIDTGLHHSVMTSMWKVVHTLAAELQVQVIATTHSRDCFESLAPIAQDNASVCIHRLERGQSRSICYDEAEIREAVRRGWEVR